MFSALTSLSPARPAARSAARFSDLDRVLEALGEVDLDVPWSPHPEAVELALLDAVFTIRTTYGSPTTGVRGWVAAYAASAASAAPAEVSGSSGDDLHHLAETATLDHLAADGKVTRQRLMGGALKVEAATAAARALAQLPGAPRSAADVRALLTERYVEARDAFASVEGLGVETFEYLLLLIGSPGRRAETAWARFVDSACGRELPPEESRSLLADCAGALALEEAQMVHAVWRHGKRA